MSFTASGAGLAFAALAALVGFFVASDVAVVDSNILDDDRLGRVVFKNMVVMYTIANVVVYSMTALSPLPPRSETRAATVAEVTSHFGLESGKEYPLQLGERFAGTWRHACRRRDFLHLRFGLMESGDGAFDWVLCRGWQILYP